MRSTPRNIPPSLLRVSETAAILRCNPQTVLNLLDKGVIRGYRIEHSRLVLIERKSLDERLKSSEVRRHRKAVV